MEGMVGQLWTQSLNGSGSNSSQMKEGVRWVREKPFSI
jgi:hypothetical protein